LTLKAGTVMATPGPHKTLYNCFIRWSRMGVFDRIFAALASEGGPPGRLMIDRTHLKAYPPGPLQRLFEMASPAAQPNAI
jgi:transposase